MNNIAHNIVGDTFEEVSEHHWDNLLNDYISTDSSSLVNLSPWD